MPARSKMEVASPPGRGDHERLVLLRALALCRGTSRRTCAGNRSGVKAAPIEWHRQLEWHRQAGELSASAPRVFPDQLSAARPSGIDCHQIVRNRTMPDIPRLTGVYSPKRHRDIPGLVVL